MFKKTKQNVDKHKIPFLWKHLSLARQDIVTFWRSMAGVVLVYASVYAVTVIGLNFVIPSFNSSNSATDALAPEQTASALTKAADSVAQGLSFVSGDQSSSLVQFILFLVASLAFIWVLRKIRKLQHVKISEAYYRGTSQFVAMFLLIIWFVILLIPATVGTTILSVGLTATSTAIETGVIILSSIVFLFLSIWLFAKYWPSFYIISLPGIRPISALKNASALTKKHRLNISLQVIGFMLLTVILAIVLVLPVALLLPKVVPYWIYALMFVFFAIGHTFMFAIYRSLVGDK